MKARKVSSLAFLVALQLVLLSTVSHPVFAQELNAKASAKTVDPKVNRRRGTPRTGPDHSRASGTFVGVGDDQQSCEASAVLEWPRTPGERTLKTLRDGLTYEF